MKYLFAFYFSVLFSLSLSAQTEPLLMNKATRDTDCREWVDSVFNKLSLKERVGQLFIHTIAPVETASNITNLKNAVNTYKVGGLLFSGGVLENQARLTNQAQEMAEVPLMITFDGEWGLSMRLKETPVYPRNMVLGCITDEKLLYEYGQEVARQLREIGAHVNFAPVADVNINPRNPVINTRSFGESPVAVADKVVAYSLGLESGGVLSVSKHFPGHGDTDVDSHHALPVLTFPRSRLDSVELLPFREAINAGVSGMMVGHLEVPALESKKGTPASLSRAITHDLLVDELGFQGLIFTDALAMKGVATHKNVSLLALKAGHDMVLSPRQLKEEIDAVLDAVKKGDISEEEINRKCRKVLTYKYILGVEEQGKIQISGLKNRINTPNARDLEQRLKTAAVTAISNNNVLPLDGKVKDIALLNVGATATFNQTVKQLSEAVSFQLKPNMAAAERKAMHDQLAKYKRIIVSIDEKQLAPYHVFFSEFAPEKQVIYVFFTPMRQLTQLEKILHTASSVVLCHDNPAYLQEYTAKGLFGEATISGRLSASIGNVFKPGQGYTIGSLTRPHYVPEEHGMKSGVLQHIDSIALKGIREGAFPGCQIVVLKDGKTMYDKAFGTFAGDKSTPVTSESIYDIASLTKTSATLLAMMKLYDKGLYNLSDKVSDHLDWLKGTDKANITIRELLYHESGMPSTIAFYQRAIDKDSYPGRLLKTGSDAQYTVQIDARTYAQPDFRFLKGMTSNEPGNEFPLHVSDNLWLNKSFSDTINNTIKEATLRDKRYRYSCVGFVVLQKVAEKLSGMPLDEFLSREFYTPMGLQRTAFLPLRYFQKDEIVPSATDNFIRKTTVQGFVHDETAAFQGGVSGNAGLFSNAREIALIHQMILDGGELDNRRYLSKETCHVFTTNKSKISHRGLGYNKPNRKNPAQSPCSSLTPWSAYGHTGFTGTAAWIDPDNKIVYVFISNRTYPDPWNNQLGKMNIRGEIQETIYKALK